MKNKKDDNKKNTSGYSENQRKMYQTMYENAAREANRRYPQALQPKAPGYSEARAARKLDINERYNKSAANLATALNYSDGDIGSVQSDVSSRSERLANRAIQRISSPVKGARPKISAKAAAVAAVKKKTGPVKK